MSKEIIHSLTKGALSFFCGTLFSRVTGLIRDVSMAFFLGSTPLLAAFMVAFRFANLFRRLLGEGPLPSGFVPQFEAIRKDQPREGAVFFRDVFSSLFVVLLGVIVLLELCLFGLIHSGLLSMSSLEIVELTMLMLPGILFICLYGISSALLQCEKKFFLPSFAPLFFNLVWILSVWLFRDKNSSLAVYALSIAVVVGFCFQFSVLVPAIWRYMRAFLSLKELAKCSLFSKDVRSMASPFILGVMGIAGTQINTALDAVFARCASLEGPAYLWYAIRIEQLPIALFGVALSSALLPPLSRALSVNDLGLFKELFNFSFYKTLAFMLPCTVALFVLSCSGVNLLYGRGGFSEEATLQTVYCLWGYGVGLLPSIFVLLMAPAFYSRKDYKTPMRAVIFSVLVNVFLNALFVFVFKWGAFSISLATSLASWCNLVFLVFYLRKHDLLPASLYQSSYRVLLVSFFSGLCVFFLGSFFGGDQTFAVLFQKGSIVFSREFTEQSFLFFRQLGIFLVSLVVLSWIFQVEEILSILKIPSKKKVIKGID